MLAVTAGCSALPATAPAPTADAIEELASDVDRLADAAEAAERRAAAAEAKADAAERRLEEQAASPPPQPSPEPEYQAPDPAEYRQIVRMVAGCLTGGAVDDYETDRIVSRALRDHRAAWESGSTFNAEARITEHFEDVMGPLIEFHREQSAKAGREICYAPFGSGD